MHDKNAVYAKLASLMASEKGWRLNLVGVGKSLAFLHYGKDLLIKLREPVIKFGLFNDEPAKVLVFDENLFDENQHRELYSLGIAIYDKLIPEYSQNKEQQAISAVLGA